MAGPNYMQLIVSVFPLLFIIGLSFIHRRNNLKYMAKLEALLRAHLEVVPTDYKETSNPPRVTARPNKNGMRAPIHMDDERAYLIEQQDKKNNRPMI